MNHLGSSDTSFSSADALEKPIGGGRHYYLEMPAVLGGGRCPINYGPRGRGEAENELIAEQNSAP